MYKGKDTEWPMNKITQTQHNPLKNKPNNHKQNTYCCSLCHTRSLSHSQLPLLQDCKEILELEEKIL
jgi:hypothetical protein